MQRARKGKEGKREERRKSESERARPLPTFYSVSVRARDDPALERFESVGAGDESVEQRDTRTVVVIRRPVGNRRYNERTKKRGEESGRNKEGTNERKKKYRSNTRSIYELRDESEQALFKYEPHDPHAANNAEQWGDGAEYREREREREGHFRLPVFAPRQILTTGVARPYWRLPLGVIVDDRESTSREGREPDNPSVDPKRAEEVTRSSSKSCRRRHIRGAVHRLLRTNFRFFTRTSRSLRRRFVAAHSYRCRRLP